jgi:hypothetical protein
LWSIPFSEAMLRGADCTWHALRFVFRGCPVRGLRPPIRVNQKQDQNWRRGETSVSKAAGEKCRRGQQNDVANGETPNAPNGGQLRISGAAMPSRNSTQEIGAKQFGSSNRFRTHNLLVDSAPRLAGRSASPAFGFLRAVSAAARARSGSRTHPQGWRAPARPAARVADIS